MSFVQKTSKTKKQKSSIDVSNDIKKLEKKITELQNKKEPNFSQFEIIVKNLQNKILMLEQKNRTLENEVKKIKPSNNTNNTEILNNVINKDLNDLKIKIEKNEDILKKLLFN
tara:strand:- start:3204 stop:3542 length:339 start_codon:yes stop_codon:yes gene_type:complete